VSYIASTPYQKKNNEKYQQLKLLILMVKIGQIESLGKIQG